MAATLLAIAFGLTASSSEAAPELKPDQQEAKAKFEETMGPSMKAMNEACETSMTLTADYENFDRAAWANKAHWSWCEPVIREILKMCESSPPYKVAISKKVKSVACVFNGVKPQEKDENLASWTRRNMSFEKGTFTFHRAPTNVNIDFGTKEALEEALNN